MNVCILIEKKDLRIRKIRACGRSCVGVYVCVCCVVEKRLCVHWPPERPKNTCA